MPGHGNQEARSLKKMPTADAHKQRLQLIKKSIDLSQLTTGKQLEQPMGRVV